MMRIHGYAIPFHARSVDLGGFVEQFTPSAVDYTLRQPIDVRMLAHHDAAKLLGRVSARTLQITKDRHGLRFDLDLPDTSDGRDAYELVKRGDLNGASFSFYVRPDGESWDFSGATPLRTVSDCSIRELSLVSWPAYPQTRVAVASEALRTSGTISIALAERKQKLVRALAR